MRAILPDLAAAQYGVTAPPVATLHIAGADRTADLVGFVHRQAALRGSESQVWLDNSDGALTGALPPKGAAVDLARGVVIAGEPATAALPRVWVERTAYDGGHVVLTCLDFWGKLDRWAAAADLVWAAADVSAHIDALLAPVGLVRADPLAGTLTLPYTLPAGTGAGAALRALCAKIPDYAFAGLGDNVRFADLLAPASPVTTFAWQPAAGSGAGHPVRDATYTTGAMRYNEIHVTGALDAGGPVTGTIHDPFEQALVGPRRKIIVDRSLTTEAACQQRAIAEFQYYRALATEIELRAAPCHGLELFDTVTLATTPWGGTNYTARVATLTEWHRPGRWEQQIGLSAGAGALTGAGAGISGLLHVPGGTGEVSDDWIRPEYLPEALITAPTAHRVGPAALTAQAIVGAAVADRSGAADYATAAAVEAAFRASAGRSARPGDVLLGYDAAAGEHRLLVKAATDPATWVVVPGAGTVV